MVGDLDIAYSMDADEVRISIKSEETCIKHAMLPAIIKKSEKERKNWAHTFNMLKHHKAKHGTGKCKSEVLLTILRNFSTLLPVSPLSLQSSFHKSQSSILSFMSGFMPKKDK
jgi:hypothetical protein